MPAEPNAGRAESPRDDADLVRAAREGSDRKALQEFIARRRQKHLLDLMGKLEWDPSYD